LLLLFQVAPYAALLDRPVIQLIKDIRMHQLDINLAFSDDERGQRDVLRVIQFLALTARPPKGSYPEETDWIRRTHEGPHTSATDIAAVTGVEPSVVMIALKALEAADFLSVEETGEEKTYALKRAWSRLLLDVEKHGWTHEGKTLRDAVMAGNGEASTTNFWGNWELHSEGYIITRELSGGIDQQASRATEKGVAALKVLQVLFPVGTALRTGA
jgi:DNA-binding transcriptional ArsR family regulator